MGKRLSPKILTKSGIMVGLGEKHEETTALFEDLRKISCDILTFGQYLAPSAKHHEVVEYVHPDEFLQYKDEAYALGFRFVASGPLVRSSYHAEEALWGTDAERSSLVVRKSIREFEIKEGWVFAPFNSKKKSTEEIISLILSAVL